MYNIREMSALVVFYVCALIYHMREPNGSGRRSAEEEAQKKKEGEGNVSDFRDHHHHQQTHKTYKDKTLLSIKSEDKKGTEGTFTSAQKSCRHPHSLFIYICRRQGHALRISRDGVSIMAEQR